MAEQQQGNVSFVKGKHGHDNLCVNVKITLAQITSCHESFGAHLHHHAHSLLV